MASSSSAFGTGCSTSLSEARVSQDSLTPPGQHAARGPRLQDPNASHSQLTRPIHTLQYHVLAYTELPRQSLSRNRHPSASWSHPTGAQVCGTYTRSGIRTPSQYRHCCWSPVQGIAPPSRSLCDFLPWQDISLGQQRTST